jgi:hypothetical protein
MWNYNPKRVKKIKVQKYPAPKKKYIPVLPIQTLPVAIKYNDPDKVLTDILKSCDESILRGKKNG